MISEFKKEKIKNKSLSLKSRPNQLPRFIYEVDGDALLEYALSYINKRAKGYTTPTGWWLAVDNGILNITIKGEK